MHNDYTNPAQACAGGYFALQQDLDKKYKITDFIKGLFQPSEIYEFG